MGAETFPGVDGKPNDEEIVAWVTNGEARLLLDETSDGAVPPGLKDKLQEFLQDEEVQSVIIYCNRISASSYLHGTLLSISRRNQSYGKKLLLRGIDREDQAAYAGYGWEIEGND